MKIKFAQSICFRALVFNDKPHYSNRNKNIYRLCFSDGFAIEPAQITYDEIPQSRSPTHIDGNPPIQTQLHTSLFFNLCIRYYCRGGRAAYINLSLPYLQQQSHKSSLGCIHPNFYYYHNLMKVDSCQHPIEMQLLTDLLPRLLKNKVKAWQDNYLLKSNTQQQQHIFLPNFQGYPKMKEQDENILL